METRLLLHKPFDKVLAVVNATPGKVMNAHGRTLMHELATTFKLTEIEFEHIINLLLEKEHEIDERTLQGSTPLMCALYSNNIRLVEILLNNGANPLAINKAGKTVFYYARNETMAEILFDHGVPRRDLEWPMMAREESEYCGM